MDQKKLICIVKNLYGYNTKKAIEHLKKTTEEEKKMLLKYFEDQSKLSFYND